MNKSIAQIKLELHKATGGALPIGPSADVAAKLAALKEQMRQQGTNFDRRMQGVVNAEKTAGTGVVLPTDKAKGGSVEPKKTVKAYKLFRVHPKHPGKLFPLFVNANDPVEMGKWQDAQIGEMTGNKVKSKIGPLAFRPGWHAGDVPVATHIGEKSDPKLTAPDTRPANHVWAEVEMPDDVDWQSVANERGTNAQGRVVPVKAHITDQIPKGGHYRYKTNSNMTGNWLIGGAMKVNKVLSDKEVRAINKAAGVADLPRATPFPAKKYGFAGGGTVAPDEWKAEAHVNYSKAPHMDKGGLSKQERRTNRKNFMEPSKDKRRFYHGSKEPNIVEFKTRKQIADENYPDDPSNDYRDERNAVFLSPDPKFTSHFSVEGYTDTGQAPTTYPVHVQVRNPFDFDKPKHRENLWKTYHDIYYNPESELYVHGPHDTASEKTLAEMRMKKRIFESHKDENNWPLFENPNVQEAIQDMGHDSFYIRERGTKNLGVYDPRRIKSAIGNRGTYDINDPDMTKAKGGLAHMAIGGQGPKNWIKGGVENVVKPLRQNLISGTDPAEALKQMQEQYSPEEMQKLSENARAGVDRSFESLHRMNAMNQWVDRNLINYIRKQMATHDDPIRKLAEQGIVHMPPERMGYGSTQAEGVRKVHGAPRLGQSPEAQAWEDAADVAMHPMPIKDLHRDYREPWMVDADPQTKIFTNTDNMHAHYLGFDHLVDILKQDLAEGRLRPEQLSKVSIEHAVRRAHEYDQERKKAMAEAQLKATESMPVHKEYPEGYKWIELALNPELPEGYKQSKSGTYVDPQGHESIHHPNYAKLDDALKYEGDTMGHCVGGYTPDVVKGKSRIFSLRDAKNEPHVTVEVKPSQHLDFNKWWDEQPKELRDEINDRARRGEHKGSIYEAPEYLSARAALPPAIKQIKGKGNAKPKKDYIPFVQDFVKSGNWSDVGDIKNADMIKHKGQYMTHAEHDDWLMNQLKPDEKARGGIIHKAEGGSMDTPDLAQSRLRMNQRTNPALMDNIGIDEALDMSPKSFVTPDPKMSGGLPVGGVDKVGDLPIGGVDQSAAPGMQLMPQQLQQPEQDQQGGLPQGGGQPPSAGPSSPGQQPPSNMLSLTPQGRALGAMAPQGMAKGGIAKQRAEIKFRLDQLAKGGGIDHYASKGGVKAERNHPAVFPPSPAIVKQDIDTMAERMARQITGETNPNKKTKQQLEREKNLPVDLRTTGVLQHMPEINMEAYKGSHLIGIPGDTSVGGIDKPSHELEPAKAAVHLHGIGEKELKHSVPMFGGKLYGAYGHPEAWAGNEAGVQPLQNSVQAIHEANPEAKILGQYVKMTPQSLDFALHNLDALLAYQEPHKFPEAHKENINKLLKEPYLGHAAYEASPGIEDPLELLLHSQMDSDFRKKIVKILSTKKNLPKGARTWEDVVYAISHPELRNLETGVSGGTMVEMDPHRNPLDLISSHPSYKHDLPTKLIGQRSLMAPTEIAYPRSTHYAREHIKTLPIEKQKYTQLFNTAKNIGLREPIDEQYINQLGEYETQLRRRILGKKKGGQVSLSEMKLELAHKSKKVK